MPRRKYETIVTFEIIFSSFFQYKAKGDESGLHIIIFDELDAICKQRGSTNNGTGVGDSVVNQLLSKVSILLSPNRNAQPYIDGRGGSTEQHSSYWNDESS